MSWMDHSITKTLGTARHKDDATHYLAESKSRK
jgi:hypothetical protein